MQGSDLRLTEHFRLSEFAVSKQFPDLAAKISFTDIEIERMRFAAVAFLQPVRNRFGPVVITSGKRSPTLNEAVGGVANSAHLYRGDRGAVDFTTAGVRCEVVFDWMRLNTPNFRKIIKYPERNFIHISFPDSSGVIGSAYEYKDGVYVKV